MSVFTTLKLAMRALWRNKVRSMLTMLGIVFGIGAVIAMVAGGQGAQQAVKDVFQSLGTNVLILSNGSQRELEGGEDVHAATSALRGVWVLSSMIRPSRRVTTRDA